MKAESGVTLIELLLAITMMTGVLLATFAVLNGFQNATRANFAQNQPKARRAVPSTASRVSSATRPVRRSRARRSNARTPTNCCS